MAVAADYFTTVSVSTVFATSSSTTSPLDVTAADDAPS
jgi:hypothetical protein